MDESREEQGKQKPTPLRSRVTNGNDEASVDDKGRMLISARQRALLSEGFAMGISEWGCIQIIPASMWRRIEEESLSMSYNNLAAELYYDRVIGQSDTNVKIDEAGRIYIPGWLRELYPVGNRVTVVGSGQRLLIWNPDDCKEWRAKGTEYKKDRVQEVMSLYAEMYKFEENLKSARIGSAKPTDSPAGGRSEV